MAHRPNVRTHVNLMVLLINHHERCFFLSPTALSLLFPDSSFARHPESIPRTLDYNNNTQDQDVKKRDAKEAVPLPLPDSQEAVCL